MWILPVFFLEVFMLNLNSLPKLVFYVINSLTFLKLKATEAEFCFSGFLPGLENVNLISTHKTRCSEF